MGEEEGEESGQMGNHGALDISWGGRYVYELSEIGYIAILVKP